MKDFLAAQAPVDMANGDCSEVRRLCSPKNEVLWSDMILILSYPYPYPYPLSTPDPNSNSNPNLYLNTNPDSKPNPNSVGLTNLF